MNQPRLVTVLLANLILGVAWTSGSDAASSGFQEIRIESHPRGWGVAQKTVKADASVVGGHVSGGPDAPRVFESRAKATAEDMEALRALVAKVLASPKQPLRQPPDQSKVGYTSVTITFGDGGAATFSAEWGQRFESETVQAIWDIVGKYHVGAW